jgi:hypothetical protein
VCRAESTTGPFSINPNNGNGQRCSDRRALVMGRQLFVCTFVTVNDKFRRGTAFAKTAIVGEFPKLAEFEA